MVYEMASPLPIFGPLLYRAFRAAAYDLPEDFIMRLEPGLDAETLRRLERGLRVLRILRWVERWTISLLAGGAAVLLGGSALVIAAVPYAAPYVWPLAAATWGLAGLSFVAWSLISLAYSFDLRKVYAFWRALQGSSLARDLA